METAIKAGIIAAVCFGVYTLVGIHVPEAHKFAFGLGGMGISYLWLTTGAAGLVTLKVVK